MKPTLGYLILSRNTITDQDTREMSAIGIYDNLYIPKGQESLVYSVFCIGRVYLNTASAIIPSVKFKVKLSDPLGSEMKTVDLTATNVNTDYGINLDCKFWLTLFKLEGRHRIDISVSTDEAEFVDLLSPTYFQVKKLS